MIIRRPQKPPRKRLVKPSDFFLLCDAMAFSFSRNHLAYMETHWGLIQYDPIFSYNKRMIIAGLQWVRC